MELAFYTAGGLHSMEIHSSVDKFCLWKNCITVITHFHIDYEWDSSDRLLFAKDKASLRLVTLSLESATKGNAKRVHCAIPISLTACYGNFFFSPFSFRNTASVFLPYYCFRFNAFACSANSGFFF